MFSLCIIATLVVAVSSQPCTPGNGDEPVGAFVAQCDDNGLFLQEQCHGSTGYCWCVNPQTGEEIPGTSKGPGEGEVNCNASPCTPGNGDEPPGAFVAQCDDNGLFLQEQCHGSTGYCWCVNPQTGEEIPETRKGPGEGEVQCPSD